MKRFLACLLALCLVAGCLTAGAAQADAQGFYTGKCGKPGANVTWTLNALTGVLTVTGRGAMEDYTADETGASTAPWYAYQDQVIVVIVSSGITGLGDYAFSGCRNLRRVVLPGRMPDGIGAGAFYRCFTLGAVSLPADCTEIKDDTFAGCASMVSVWIPDGVTAIGKSAFQGCVALEALALPRSLKTVGDNAFQSCVGLHSLTLPDGVTSVGANAFSDCYRMERASLPDSLTELPEGLFQQCHVLESVTIPKRLTTIGDSCFSMCTSLKEVSLPDTVTRIGARAFGNCTTLTDLRLPAGLIELGRNALSYLTKLEHLTVPEGITALNLYLTEGSNATLTSLHLPNSMQSFHVSDCVALRELNLPENLTDLSLIYCSSLTDVEIPAQVTTLDLSSNDGLRTIRFLGETPPEINNLFSQHVVAFYPDGNEAYANLPTYNDNILWVSDRYLEGTLASGTGSDGLTWLLTSDGVLTVSGQGEMADTPWQTYRNAITQVRIENGVTSVAESAFSDYPHLEKIQLADSVTKFGRNDFSSSLKLKELTLAAGVAEIDADTLASCGNLEQLRVLNPACVFVTQDSNQQGLPVKTSVWGYAGSTAQSLAHKEEQPFRDLETGAVSGVWGALTWIFDEAWGEMRISGNGEIPAASILPEDGTVAAPWRGLGEGLRSVTVEQGVTGIGEYAFQGCPAEAYSLPNSLRKIGGGAFGGCRVSTLTIPGSVSVIEEGTLTNCDRLILQEGVTEIKYGAFFMGSENFGEIWIPSTVRKIDENAFCMFAGSALNKSGGVFRVDPRNPAYFSDAYGVLYEKATGTLLATPGLHGTYIMPEGARRIVHNAFEGNPLENVVIPSTMEEIGLDAFHGCRNLQNVIVLSKDCVFAKGEDELVYPATFYRMEPFNPYTIPFLLHGYPDSTTEEYVRLNEELMKNQTNKAFVPLGGYNILDGDHGIFGAWSDSNSVHADGALETFTGVYVNGALVSPENYTLTEGSTIVTFRDEYLRTLPEGQYLLDIGYTDGSAMGDFTVKSAVEVTGVTVTPENLTLEVGKSATLTVLVSPEDATDKTLTFTSSNPAVATVDDNGKVTAVKAGTVEITVTAGGKSAVCHVTVTQKAASSTNGSAATGDSTPLDALCATLLVSCLGLAAILPAKRKGLKK